jgi:hypothetical protein
MLSLKQTFSKYFCWKEMKWKKIVPEKLYIIKQCHVQCMSLTIVDSIDKSCIPVNLTPYKAPTFTSTDRKLLIKQNDLNFSIVNILFLCSNIPLSSAYGIIGSQLSLLCTWSECWFVFFFLFFFFGFFFVFCFVWFNQTTEKVVRGVCTDSFHSQHFARFTVATTIKFNCRLIDWLFTVLRPAHQSLDCSWYLDIDGGLLRLTDIGLTVGVTGDTYSIQDF